MLWVEITEVYDIKELKYKERTENWTNIAHYFVLIYD